MKQKWFIFFLSRSLSERKGRVFLSILSVALAVSVIACFISITAGLQEKLGAELKPYGANLIISSSKGEYLDADVIRKVTGIQGVEDASGQTYSIVEIQGHAVEAVGLDFERLKAGGSRIEGKWPSKKYEILTGINLKNALKIKAGEEIILSKEGHEQKYLISGFIEKGGSEDSSMLLSLEDSQELFGLNGKLSAVLARGNSLRLEEIRKRIASELQDVSVKTIKQVASAEMSLLTKMQSLILMVTAVLLFAAVISIGSTTGATVIERRQEIGIMKALGATSKEIDHFYKAEALITGFAGGIAGFIVGYLIAHLVSRSAFGTFGQVPWYVFFISLSLGVLISIVAGYFPVRSMLRLNPAVILRGD